MSLKAVVLAPSKIQAEESAAWVVSGDVDEGIYKKRYEIQGRKMDVTCTPLYAGMEEKKPTVVDSVLIFYDKEAEVEGLKPIIDFYMTVPIKVLISSSRVESLETSLKAKTLPKSDPMELVSHMIEAHNQMVKLIKAVFDAFDKDNSGFIDLVELRAVATELGADIPEGDVHLIMKELDTNKDGKISLEEFTAWWRGGRKGKSLSLRRMVQGTLKTNSKLQGLVEKLKKYGDLGVESKFGEELLESHFNIHLNKVEKPGVMLTAKVMIGGEAVKEDVNLMSNMFGTNKDDFFACIGFKPKGGADPAKVKDKLFKLVTKSLIVVGSLVPGADMVSESVEIDTAHSMGKVWMHAKPKEEMTMMAEQGWAMFPTALAQGPVGNSVEFYVTFASDFDKLCQDEVPMYEHLFNGLSIEIKGSCKKQVSEMLTTMVAQLGPMTQMLPPPVVPLLTAFATTTLKGEIVFEADAETREAVKENVTSIFEMANISFPALKGMGMDPAMAAIDQLPIAKETYEFIKTYIEDIEIMAFAPGVVIKLYFLLPGLSTLITP